MDLRNFGYYALLWAELCKPLCWCAGVMMQKVVLYLYEAVCAWACVKFYAHDLELLYCWVHSAWHALSGRTLWLSWLWQLDYHCCGCCTLLGGNFATSYVCVMDSSLPNGVHLACVYLYVHNWELPMNLSKCSKGSLTLVTLLHDAENVHEYIFAFVFCCSWLLSLLRLQWL